jgi:hypothetical protein
VRLFYSSLPAVSTTPLSILSAISSDGLTFSFESGLPVSTSASSGSADFPLVVRATETFRWRLYYAFVAAGSTTPVIDSVLTLLPKPVSINPPSTFYTNPYTPFTLTGEIFGPAPAVSFLQGATSIAATGVSAVSDLSITGVFPSSGVPTGFWDVRVTNADGNFGTLAHGFFVDTPPGIVALTDNLIRPRNGDKTKIDITVFQAGSLTVKLYTLAGQFVKTLLDQPVSAGTTTVYWSGDTGAGHTVASGLYLLHVEGPRTSTTKKIVVVK